MMNINIVAAASTGYLERVRELTRRARRRADLRRGQDRRGGRRRRRDRAVRRHARRRLPGQGDLRRLPGGAIGMTDELAELVAAGNVRQAGHVQRQPAGDGRRAGDAARRPHRRRLHAAAGAATRADGGLRARSSPSTACPATRSAWAPRAASSSRAEPVREYRDYLTKIHHDLRPRVAVPHEQRHLHDAGRGRGVDAVVVHTDADLQRYLDVFETFARDVTAACAACSGRSG